jgi:hypothetical protein
MLVRGMRIFMMLSILMATHRCEEISSIYESLKIKSENTCLRDSINPNNPKQILMKKNGCVIYYVHNHKSGGTTICNTADRAGHRVNMKDNCNIPSSNRSDWANVVERLNLTFVAQEDPPFQPDLTRDNYIYMTTVRDPYDRIVSDLHHTFCLGTLDHARTTAQSHKCTFDIQHASLSDIVLSDCFDSHYFWYVTSHLYLRMFSGCYGRECTVRHLAAAKDKLNVMTVILVTDTREDFHR